MGKTVRPIRIYACPTRPAPILVMTSYLPPLRIWLTSNRVSILAHIHVIIISTALCSFSCTLVSYTPMHPRPRSRLVFTWGTQIHTRLEDPLELAIGDPPQPLPALHSGDRRSIGPCGGYSCGIQMVGRSSYEGLCNPPVAIKAFIDKVELSASKHGPKTRF